MAERSLLSVQVEEHLRQAFKLKLERYSWSMTEAVHGFVYKVLQMSEADLGRFLVTLADSKVRYYDEHPTPAMKAGAAVMKK